MITEYLLLLILLLLAEIVKRLKNQRPLALAGAGMLQPWQAWELLNAQTKASNVARWNQ